MTQEQYQKKIDKMLDEYEKRRDARWRKVWITWFIILVGVSAINIWIA